ncbi:hypothetical protein [Roseobacter weihaiensis]|uniref:hypothetical protein n=1 Tax=Roseobacter weihaiensis TaxID=2763262 RepID=UPI001D0AF0B3|nr:hypothetical protein [Roseobacter sp. H9]
MMDHTRASPSGPCVSELDMRHLTKPRGKGYTMRLIAPEVLVGTGNPWTGKPFGREIKLGLNTRSHAEAVRLRDIRLGQIRQLEADALAQRGRRSVGRIIDLSPESAAEWRQMREEAKDPDSIDYVLTDKLEKAERAGFGKEAKRFADVVLKGKLPLAEALEQYLEDRRPGNPLGLDPLKPATMADVRSSMRHLQAFLRALWISDGHRSAEQCGLACEP